MDVLKWLIICLTLCIDTFESCKWTTFRLRMQTKQCLAHVSDMGKFPATCLEVDVPGIFPNDIYNSTQGEDVYFVASKSFGYMSQIFDSKLTPSTWNNALLQLFKNCIFRQVTKVKECVRAGSGESSVNAGNTTLHAYFEKLNTVLKEKEHSMCAWEIVKLAVQDNLKEFKNFLDRAAKAEARRFKK